MDSWKSCWAKPECNNDFRNWGLKEQPHLHGQCGGAGYMRSERRGCRQLKYQKCWRITTIRNFAPQKKREEWYTWMTWHCQDLLETKGFKNGLTGALGITGRTKLWGRKASAMADVTNIPFRKEQIVIGLWAV
jgi:hypothetical protein